MDRAGDLAVELRDDDALVAGCQHLLDDAAQVLGLLVDVGPTQDVGQSSASRGASSSLTGRNWTGVLFISPSLFEEELTLTPVGAQRTHVFSA